MVRLLAALGDPQDRLPPVVHVAGTNGKGSTIAFMKAMVEAAGLTAHVYTSPHLVRFHERIAPGGAPVDEAVLAELLEECEAANDGAPITFFEITTAAAFLAFSRQPADIALIETGLGGRFDATNAIAAPAVSAITPIAMDHMHFLGDSLAAIAGEKAGILRPGGVCVAAPQTPEAAAVLEARAAALNTRLLRFGAEWTVDAQGAYQDALGDLQMPLLGLCGPHQRINAGLAVAALRAPGVPPVAVDAMQRGLRSVRWPARLQRLDSGPLPARLPAGWELWLDGGHNPAAAAALAAAVGEWPPAPLYVVLGMLDTRDPGPFLAPLAPLISRVGCVPVPGESAAWAPDALAGSVTRSGFRATAHGSVADALAAVAEEGGEPARVLICGSLYLAGAVLAETDAF